MGKKEIGYQKKRRGIDFECKVLVIQIIIFMVLVFYGIMTVVLVTKNFGINGDTNETSIDITTIDTDTLDNDPIDTTINITINDNTETIPEIIEKDEESTTSTSEKNLPTLSYKDPNCTYYYNISEADKILIAKVVWKEARGESFEGKVAVASVVLNRYFYEHQEWFDRSSIENIITQTGQFASIKNVTMEDLKAVPECMEAVDAACKGYDPTREVFKSGAFFFLNPEKVDEELLKKFESQGITIMNIGNHNFSEYYPTVNDN